MIILEVIGWFFVFLFAIILEMIKVYWALFTPAFMFAAVLQHIYYFDDWP